MSAPIEAPLPRGLRLLGWSGLLPFAAPVAAAAVLPEWRQGALSVFIAYAAVILSFLGGARWGRGLGAGLPASRYAEAVLPSLLGFTALLLVHHPHAALVVLAVGFAGWLLLDLRDPLWSRAYKRMRLGISAVVLALHAAWWMV
ncbi:DUF3429 domain-containing protein [Cognatilysobacter tabacisoli]|uniref:DUF3429 domain-containing protein n=1 Tax=Cognatilysobacter tabacisoli TaxID=2315424 RepID=UPI001300459E|nr:DUF3429 domain-containing protein [Lysobacter tabacisoli]